ncbi:hypothetical protein THAOC_08898 [Thalassiosira oceanica]|uniref:Uncharacterized protein n=1 Tax=Thalassiosira oceanica TaxID=159749 RepID=K0T8V5_THAOC|nr:hypothetical protein THAOC_08898 [Thalassiosira oceanica]|eukprot:EJK69806.1 hypothetical protein THAOC_08898 [Thalassiosira oceanica]
MDKLHLSSSLPLYRVPQCSSQLILDKSISRAAHTTTPAGRRPRRRVSSYDSPCTSLYLAKGLDIPLPGINFKFTRNTQVICCEKPTTRQHRKVNSRRARHKSKIEMSKGTLIHSRHGHPTTSGDYSEYLQGDPVHPVEFQPTFPDEGKETKKNAGKKVSFAHETKREKSTAKSRAAKDRNLGQFKAHYDRVLPSLFAGIAVDGLKKISVDFIERAKNWLKSDDSSIVDKHKKNRLDHVLEKCSTSTSYAELWWMTVESFCKVPRGKDGNKKNYRKRSYDDMDNMPELPPLEEGGVAHEFSGLTEMDDNEEDSSEDSLLSDDVQSFSASLSGVDDVSLYELCSEVGPSTDFHPQFRPSEDLMLGEGEQKNKKCSKAASDRQLNAFKACFGSMVPEVAESAQASDTLDQDDFEQFKEFSIKMLENCTESKIQAHKKERLKYVLDLGITSVFSIWCLSVKAFYLKASRGEAGKKKRYKSSKVAD